MINHDITYISVYNYHISIIYKWLLVTATQLMQFRRKLGMSRAKLSNAIGASESAIWNWETGVNAIPKYIDLACKAYLDEYLKSLNEKL